MKDNYGNPISMNIHKQNYISRVYGLYKDPTKFNRYDELKLMKENFKRTYFDFEVVTSHMEFHDKKNLVRLVITVKA